ncbi:S8 family peptidase [Streptomyces sp. NPDC003023]|uniref:S8 family peptidase n=1 Tax=Streptomyces sp. NPDC003023 TaxID=3364675 RepID=UPI00368F9F28
MFRSRHGVITVGGLALACLMGSGAAAAQPDEHLRVPEGRVVPAADPIPGRYIVVLKDTAIPPRIVKSRVTSLVREYGGKVRHTYGSAIKGYAAEMSAAQAHRLAADPQVAFVEQDGTERIAETQPNPPSWGLDRVDQRNLPLNDRYTYPSTAADVSAYIIDTGIQTTHEQFAGRSRIGVDTVGDGRNGQDCHGHGTHVAGTLGGKDFGIAKQVDLIAVRVIGCGGTGPTSQIIAGVDWVTANAVKPAVANVSIRGSISAAKDEAFRKSIAAGITYVVGSGNDGRDACNYSPGHLPEALTVQNSTSADQRASTSNYGKCTDLFAPGTRITSAWIGTNTSTRTASGTSMATPHVGGAAALYLAAHPAATPAEVHAAVINSATPGKVSNAGPGSPNRLLFINNPTS